MLNDCSTASRLRKAMAYAPAGLHETARDRLDVVQQKHSSRSYRLLAFSTFQP
jgi:hypothetical protein